MTDLALVVRDVSGLPVDLECAGRVAVERLAAQRIQECCLAFFYIDIVEKYP